MEAAKNERNWVEIYMTICMIGQMYKMFLKIVFKKKNYGLNETFAFSNFKTIFENNYPSERDDNVS